MRNKPRVLTVSVLSSVLVAASAWAADSSGEPGRESGAPNPLNNVYFGEQHLHTADSPDAFAMGTRNSQDDAFKFCKGEAIKKSTGGGHTVQKKTPYDWCAVTDHAVMMGLLPMSLDTSSPLYKTKVAELIRSGTPKDMDAAFGIIMASVQKGHPPAGFDDMALQRTAWDAKKKNANKHNDPGKFTTLIAFEWTSIPYGQNLHRNVFFRDDTGPEMPYSTLDSDRAEDLWTYMDVQRSAGHEVFAIPHNSNVSNGLMFPTVNSYGQPIDKAWIERRAKHEVAVEILQTKGQSDAHPALSPHDEFADFETGFKHLLGTGGVVGRIDNSYVRNALIDGVGWQEYLGANPHKFGIVAGADAHTAFSDNEEFNYTGVHGINDATAKTRLSQLHRCAWDKRRYREDTPVGGGPDRGRGGDRVRHAGRYRSLGARKHAHGNLRRHQAQGDIRNVRAADPLALLRGLGLRRESGQGQGLREEGLRGRCPDGRRPTAKTEARQGADVRGLGAERPEQRQPRPHSNHQGLVQERLSLGADLRCGLV